jgi:hypothetical protein
VVSPQARREAVGILMAERQMGVNGLWAGGNLAFAVEVSIAAART